VKPYVSHLDAVVDLELSQRWVQHVVAMLPDEMATAVQLGAQVDYAITYTGVEGARRLFVRAVGSTWSATFFAPTTKRVELRRLLDAAGWVSSTDSQLTWPWDLATED
jgi:nicotinamide mononucleotide (NMN) deamidase PncC